MAAVTDANSALTYDSALTSAANKLSENVLGKSCLETSEDQISTQVIAKYSIYFFTVRFPIIFTSQGRLLEFTRGREC